MINLIELLSNARRVIFIFLKLNAIFHATLMSFVKLYCIVF